MKQNRKYFIIFTIILFFSIFPDFLLCQVQSNTKNSNIIETYFLEGVNFYISRDFKNAAEMWKKVLDREPSHKRARMYFEKAYDKYQEMETNFYQGLRRYKNDECEKAIPYFKRTLLVNPRHEKARHYLTLSYDCIKIRIKIVDKPDAKGKVISDREITTDDVLKLYAVGFDGKGNFVGPIEVKWESTGTLDSPDKDKYSTVLNYTPSTFDTEGTMKATLKGLIPGETGKITVKPGRLSYIKIMDGPDFTGEEVTFIKMTTDQTLRLYAAGFDKNDVYVGDVAADWSSSGELRKIDVRNSQVLNFSPARARVKGRIIAASKNGPVAIISNTDIRAGQIHYVRIEDAPDGKGNEVYSVNTTTDDTLVFYSAGYDAKDNYVSDVKVEWETKDDLERIKKFDTVKFIFKPTKAEREGRIEITKDGIIGDDTGTIRVKPGKVKFIAIVKEPSGKGKPLKLIQIKAGEKLPVYAAGFDASDGYVELTAADWKLTGDFPQTSINSARKIDLFFTNAPLSGKIDLSHQRIMAQKNTVLKVLTGDPFMIVASSSPSFSKQNVVNEINITSDESFRFYAFLVDRYYNQIKKIPFTGKPENVKGQIISLSNSTMLEFIPQSVGRGHLKIQTQYTQNSTLREFSSLVPINITPGAMSDIVFLKDHQSVVVSSFTLYVNTPVIISASGLDSKKNLIGPARGRWTLSFEGTNYILDENSEETSFTIDKIIPQAVLSFSNEIIKKEFSITVLSEEIVTLKVLRPEDRRIVTNIVLPYEETLKLLSGGYDKKGNYIRLVECFWETTGQLDQFENETGFSNVYVPVNGDVQGMIILTNQQTGRIRAAFLKVLSAPLVEKKIEGENVVIYYVYNGDNLSHIVARLLKIPYEWETIRDYATAVGSYNKLSDIDLIFPKQNISIPYFTVEKETTREQLALKLFGDRTCKDKIIIYKKSEEETITPQDKLIIKDINFISTGKLDVSFEQKREDREPE
ncbi:MAG: hypothetical protein JW827_05960 [Spirochaetes bacterium]|nr:hypothetical protein [Spirochaetota bacterium]